MLETQNSDNTLQIENLKSKLESQISIKEEILEESLENRRILNDKIYDLNEKTELVEELRVDLDSVQDQYMELYLQFDTLSKELEVIKSKDYYMYFNGNTNGKILDFNVPDPANIRLDELNRLVRLGYKTRIGKVPTGGVKMDIPDNAFVDQDHALLICMGKPECVGVDNDRNLYSDFDNYEWVTPSERKSFYQKIYQVYPLLERDAEEYPDFNKEYGSEVAL